MDVLNLYAGIGGNRKLWADCNVTAVEWDENTANVYKDYFPNDEVIVTDAHQYLLDHYKEYDFIWTSPPCPTHSQMKRTRMLVSDSNKHADKYSAPEYPDMKLYQEIILLQNLAPDSIKWVVENVDPYYSPLIPAEKLNRHLIWSNFQLGRPDFEDDKSKVINDITSQDTIYGFNVKDSDIENKRKALRNMVDPKLGNYIYNRAKDITIKSETTQSALDL